MFPAAFSYLLMNEMLFKTLEPFVFKEFRTDYLENFGRDRSNFQNNLCSYIYYGQNYMLGVNLAQTSLVVWTLELKFYKKHFRQCVI